MRLVRARHPVDVDAQGRDEAMEEAMTDELKPCPFCGGTAKPDHLDDWKGAGEAFGYSCDGCEHATPWYRNAEAAGDYWNACKVDGLGSRVHGRME